MDLPNPRPRHQSEGGSGHGDATASQMQIDRPGAPLSLASKVVTMWYVIQQSLLGVKNTCGAPQNGNTSPTVNSPVVQKLLVGASEIFVVSLKTKGVSRCSSCARLVINALLI